jgi:hypothetical protein
LGRSTRVPFENGAACRMPERVSRSTSAFNAATSSDSRESATACLRISATNSSRSNLAKSDSLMPPTVKPTGTQEQDGR